ncbi:MAG: hypothetical protein C0524_01160 [Rhodobacter sp.]|nr:hypothetical protein [Rhodobacter sp.]
MTCAGPAGHSCFSTPVDLPEFAAETRGLSGGKPAGYKLCISQPWEFMADGKEGGTGAAPWKFMGHFGKLLRDGLSFVRNALVGIGVRDRIRAGCDTELIRETWLLTLPSAVRRDRRKTERR